MNDNFEELVLSISSKFVIKSNLTLFQMNEAEALKNARDWTRKYAMGSGAGPWKACVWQDLAWQPTARGHPGPRPWPLNI